MQATPRDPDRGPSCVGGGGVGMSGQFTCMARKNGTAGANDPQECYFPECGCAAERGEGVAEMTEKPTHERIASMRAELQLLRADLAASKESVRIALGLLAEREKELSACSVELSAANETVQRLREDAHHLSVGDAWRIIYTDALVDIARLRCLVERSTHTEDEMEWTRDAFAALKEISAPTILENNRPA